MIKLSLRNVLRNKRRSFLTLLGVMIGVGAIVSLVSVSLGIAERANNVLGTFQSLWILEEGAIDVPFSFIDKDKINEIENVRGVELVTPEVWGTADSIEVRSINLGSSDRILAGAEAIANMLFVVGIDPVRSEGYEPSPYYNVVEGRKISSSDMRGVMVGRTLADLMNLFVGSSMRINDKTYHVIGIFETDARIFEFFIVGHIDEVREIVNVDEDIVNNFQVIPKDPSDLRSVKSRIELRFEDELAVFDVQSYSDQLMSFLDNLTAALWGVSAIAGIVGGIGVMNTMLMSVMERIKEFGVLKAVGWQDKHVMIMIIMESVVLSIVGGVLGMGLGYGVGYMVEYYTAIPIKITVELLGQAMLFALTLGFVGSLYPAYRSSHMEAVEAIRY